jgi:Ni/Co efflux regulator RcnB
MNKLSKLFTVSALSLTLLTSASFAQDHRDDHGQNRQDEHHQDGQHDQAGGHYVRHDDWKKGHRMNNSDWSRGQRIDYRQYHLSAPRRGYEWRQVDGNYVMAAVATGLIASVIASNNR